MASNVDKTLNFVNQFIFLMAFAVKCTLQFLGFLINFVIVISVWSSRPEVFCKKGVLRNFAKFTWKHLYHSLFLIKLQSCSWYLKRFYEGESTAKKVFKYGVFWSVFSRSCTKYRKMQKSKNSVFGHFSRSEHFKFNTFHMKVWRQWYLKLFMTLLLCSSYVEYFPKNRLPKSILRPFVQRK